MPFTIFLLIGAVCWAVFTFIADFDSKFCRLMARLLMFSFAIDLLLSALERLYL